MPSSRRLVRSFIVSILGMGALATACAYHYSDPFPPLAASLSSPANRLSDFAGIAMGFRKLTADFAWVQALIYYGTHKGGDHDYDHDHDHKEEEGREDYPHFKAMCQRVVQIDPYFLHVYYYGAGILGWNLDRIEEAEELLASGIRANPKEWRLQQFLAAIAFQKNHNVNALVDFLKVFVKQPDCPNLLRSILANIYKRQQRYREALEVWMLVYETQDRTYLDRAAAQIDLLTPLALSNAPQRRQNSH